MVDCGIFLYLEDQLFESLRSSNIMVPSKVPSPTPAPDRGGPVACLGGPVACLQGPVEIMGKSQEK